MTNEYYIWTMNPRTGNCWHGLKPVSLERATIKVAQLQTKGDGQYYWYEPVHAEPPDDQKWFWTEEWQAGEKQVDKEIAEGKIEIFDTMDEFLATLKGECAHVLPEQCCQFCQPHEDELELI